MRAISSMSMLALSLTSIALGQSASETASPAQAEREAAMSVLRDVLPADVVAALLPDAAVHEPGLEPVDDDDAAGVKPPVQVIVRGAGVQGVPLMSLPAVDVQQLLDEDAQMAQVTKSLRFGVGRNLLAEMADGAWLWMDGQPMQPGQKGANAARQAAPQDAGWLWLLDVQGDDAVALRIHLLNMFLPEGATLIAYAPDDVHQVVGPYEEAGLFDDGDLWLPTIVSQRVRIECWVPASALVNPQQAPQQPLFVLDRLQHVYRDPLKPAPGEEGEEEGDEGGIAGGGCHNQIVCHPEWLDLGQAVAGIGTIGNNSIWCSGQLLRTEIDDETPYYLTANHCLNTNFEARSSEIYWEYQATVCGDPPPALNTVPHSNVCTLVRTGAGSDYTLLMIEGPIPNDVEWASWSSVDAGDGTDVLCIHHPLGKQKRISFGDKASNPTCGGALTHIRSNWNDGVTQPGSSGSGLFRVDNGQLIGQLHCGSSDCGFVTNDSYGAFFVTYPLIADKLDEGDDDNREDNDTCGDAVLLDPDVYPNRIVKSTDSDWYRIRVPAGRTMTATAKFKHAWGDIDLRLYSACGQPPIDSSTGTGNTETVTYTNNTGSLQNVRLRAYLFNDVRNSYKLTVTIEN